MPGGGAAFAHQLAADGTVTISEPGGYGDSGGGCDGTIVNSTVTIVTPSGDPTGGTQASGPAIVGASVPVDLATDGQGNLAIVSAGSETVFFTTAATVDPLQSFSPGCVSVGGVPVPGQAVAVDFYAANNVWIAQTREPATIAVMNANGISQTIELGGESRADTGHYLFHHNASDKTALACASCHPEGHEDNHVWVFDTLGKRRTQTVSGHVLETAPLHWNGDMDDLGMIMHEVFVNRMGGSPQGPRHVEAFGSWLNTIPAMPASTTATDTQISHGKELFARADVGCAGCHSGSHFTNNQNQDVGTGRDFQVPTLVGVSSRAPFMHDGCAKTLKERFTNDASCTGGDKHGKISGLSASDLDDLVAYLETL
jgi:cytochrome c553